MPQQYFHSAKKIQYDPGRRGIFVQSERGDGFDGSFPYVL